MICQEESASFVIETAQYLKPILALSLALLVDVVASVTSFLQLRNLLAHDEKRCSHSN